jgi:hypothetical protein
LINFHCAKKWLTIVFGVGKKIYFLQFSYKGVHRRWFTSFIADKYEEYDQIYTDVSLKDEKVNDEISILNIQCRTASDHNGNEKYNTNKQTDDH